MSKIYILSHVPGAGNPQRPTLLTRDRTRLLGAYRSVLDACYPGDTIFVLTDPDTDDEEVLHVALVAERCVIELDPRTGVPLEWLQ